jgi:hypothetical protein
MGKVSDIYAIYWYFCTLISILFKYEAFCANVCAPVGIDYNNGILLQLRVNRAL